MNSAWGRRLGASTLSLLACGDQISVGTDVFGCEQLAALCGTPTIELATSYTGVRTDVTATLGPTWSRPTAAEVMVRAKDSGLWLFDVTKEGRLRTQHVSPSGDFAPEQTLSPPTGAYAGAAVVASIVASPDPAGPLLHVQWSQLGERDCSGVIATPAANTLCPFKAELIALDPDDLSRSRRTETCLQCGYGRVEAVYRSRDASRVELQGQFRFAELTADGQPEWTTAQFGGREPIGSATIDADHWVVALASSQNIEVGLSVVSRGGAFDYRVISQAVGSGNFPRALALISGSTPGRYTLVVPRISPTFATGDLSVVSFDSTKVVDEQVMVREGRTDLRLAAAAMDDAGSVFVAAATAESSASPNQVMCKFPGPGTSTCLRMLVDLDTPQFPEGPKSSAFVATTPGTVYGVGHGKLMRFDVP
ncbi:MAG: hypothetical protein JWN04_5175 [Myxococcaceae bacterium]|nr:hypothetical protein [Myxococcaceae bacterium]